MTDDHNTRDAAAERIAALEAALRRLIASDDAHATIHASDGDDVFRMVEYAAAFAHARAVLTGSVHHGEAAPVRLGKGVER